MKKILLIIALLNTLIFSKIVDKDYDTNKLQSLAYTKWEELDSKFKAKFLKDSKKYMPILLNNSKVPISNKILYEKQNIRENDYYYISIYLRYLEFKKENKKIINIYNSMLQGLDSIKKLKISVKNYIFSIKINKIINKNIQNTIDSKSLNKKQINQLLNYFSKYAIFDSHRLIDNINSEFDFVNKIFSKAITIKKRDLKHDLGININFNNIKKFGKTLSIYLIKRNEELRIQILDILQKKEYHEQKLEAKKLINKFKNDKSYIENFKKINNSKTNFENLSYEDKELLYNYIVKRLIIMINYEFNIYIKAHKDYSDLINRNIEIVKELKAIK